jgi:hypothetical protein
MPTPLARPSTTAAVSPPAAATPAEPVVAETTPATPVSSEAAEKVIGEPTVIKGGQGISHGLSGKVSQGEMARLLHEQRVTINGHDVALADTDIHKSLLVTAAGPTDTS